jgi:hypothetical protein
MPLLAGGATVVGGVVLGGGGVVLGGGGVVLGGGGVVIGGVVAGGVVVGACCTTIVVGGASEVWPAGAAGGCRLDAVCELDVSASGRMIAAATTTAIRSEIITRLVTASP